MKNRKNKITNLLKIGILLFGISLLLWNCEQEEIVQIKSHNPLDYMKFEELSFTEIPFSSSNSNVKARNQDDIDVFLWAKNNDIYLNPDRFVKAIDSLGNEAYTTFLYIKNTPNNVFYNLVIPKKRKIVLLEIRLL